MLLSTQGIVFHIVPYADNKVIAKIYTREFGLQSFVISISRTKSGKIKSPLLQPLNQLELRVEKKDKSTLHVVKEISLSVPYSHLHTDIIKTSIALFVAEVLYKSVREEEKNEDLFDFISKALQVLDLAHEGVANFHLVFMMNLTRYLGFSPQDNTEGPESLFDLTNGTFVSRTPQHFNFLDPLESRLFELIAQTDFQHMHEVPLNAERRKVVLNALIRYYESHVHSMQRIQSHEVLAQVLE
jgi:DNA repair protein RecO (recombination protein O)